MVAVAQTSATPQLESTPLFVPSPDRRGPLPAHIWIRRDYWHLAAHQPSDWCEQHQRYETRDGTPAAPAFIIRHWWGKIFTPLPTGQLEMRV